MTEKIEDICDKINVVYNAIRETDGFEKCLNTLMNTKSCMGMYSQQDEKEEIYKKIFPILFSYDLLFFTHRCLNDLCVIKGIKNDHLQELIEAIEKFL